MGSRSTLIVPKAPLMRVVIVPLNRHLTCAIRHGRKDIETGTTRLDRARSPQQNEQRDGLLAFVGLDLFNLRRRVSSLVATTIEKR
jgi:hypothetical protein